jgi:3-hydroxyisobutyrate dehydrogenase-like beta-hydroxyacid dehydrogenase
MAGPDGGEGRIPRARRQKDLNHFLREARQLRSLPGVAASAHEAYEQAVEQGHGEQDYAA